MNHRRSFALARSRDAERQHGPCDVRLKVRPAVRVGLDVRLRNRAEMLNREGLVHLREQGRSLSGPGDDTRRPGRERRLQPGSRAFDAVGSIRQPMHRPPGTRVARGHDLVQLRLEVAGRLVESGMRFGSASRNIGSVRFVSRKNTRIHFGCTPLATT